MPKDLGTWAFILSLAAIVLMYPIGLLINFTAPKLETWFASWSRDRLASRIEVLQERLHHHKLHELPHPVHIAILRACLLITGQLGIVVQAGLGILYFGKATIISQNVLYLLMFLNMGMTIGISLRIRRPLRRYSVKYRSKIAEQLVDAEMRLRKAYSQADKQPS
jgi:hypothetical protein